MLVLLAGCAFNARSQASGDARIDGSTFDAPGDGPGDGGGSATPDAPAMPDARVLAQVSYVHGISGVGMATQATLTLTLPIVAGDLCVLSVGINGNSISSVTDTGGNTFAGEGTAGGATVYVAANMHAGANDTITIKFSGTTGFAAAAAQYRGLAPTAPVEASSAASGTGAAFDSGATATSHPHDLLVGLAVSNGTMAAGTGYTQRVGAMYSLIEDQEVTSSGSYHATATAGSNLTWSIRELALKAAD
jgi:hypothetical protein